jgi:hypothetical protein
MTDIIVDLWPPVGTQDKFSGFVSSWMTSARCVMMQMNDFFLKILVWRDINVILPQH